VTAKVWTGGGRGHNDALERAASDALGALGGVDPAGGRRGVHHAQAGSPRGVSALRDLKRRKSPDIEAQMLADRT